MHGRSISFATGRRRALPCYDGRSERFRIAASSVIPAPAVARWSGSSEACSCPPDSVGVGAERRPPIPRAHQRQTDADGSVSRLHTARCGQRHRDRPAPSANPIPRTGEADRGRAYRDRPTARREPGLGAAKSADRRNRAAHCTRSRRRVADRFRCEAIGACAIRGPPPRAARPDSIAHAPFDHRARVLVYERSMVRRKICATVPRQRHGRAPSFSDDTISPLRSPRR